MGLAAASGLNDLFSGQLGGPENPVLTFPEILTSRTVLQRVALSSYRGGTVMTALGIKGGMDSRTLDQGVRELSSRVQVSSNPRSGIIAVSAVTGDSLLSSCIVSRMLEELDRFNVESRVTRGRATREFVQARMDEAKRDLGLAEQSLMSFRQNNLRIGNSPELQLEQARLERNVEARSELYRLLARQFEGARIEEKRDTPTFAVMEAPAPPARKYRPRVLFNIAVAMLAAAAISMLTEYWPKTRLRVLKRQTRVTRERQGWPEPVEN